MNNNVVDFQWRIQDLWKGRAGNPNSARPEKVARRGGGGGGGGLRHIFPLIFFASFTLLGRGTVRLPDRPPGWQAKKNHTQKKQNRKAEKGGGGVGAAADSAPLDPPLDFRVMRRLCHRQWNWQSVNHIPGIHDNGLPDHGLWRLTLKGIHNGRKTFDMMWRKLCLLRK